MIKLTTVPSSWYIIIPTFCYADTENMPFSVEYRNNKKVGISGVEGGLIIPLSDSAVLTFK